MEASGLEIVRMELKYCERCGGLWIRECGSGEVYCSECVAEMLDLPTPRLRKSPPPPKNDMEIKSQSDAWAAFCGEGGNA